jgi:hypothetical protein
MCTCQSKKNYSKRRLPGVHVCNPSYLGGRDQEDRCLRSDWENSCEDPVSKNTQHKKGLYSEYLLELGVILVYKKIVDYLIKMHVLSFVF